MSNTVKSFQVLNDVVFFLSAWCSAGLLWN